MLNIVFALFGFALAACAPAAEPTAPVWVFLSQTDRGFELRVGDEIVTLDQLDEAILRNALDSNPGLKAEEVRRDVRVFLSSRLDADARLGREALDFHTRVLQALRAYEKVGIVGEDQRR